MTVEEFAHVVVRKRMGICRTEASSIGENYTVSILQHERLLTIRNGIIA